MGKLAKTFVDLQVNILSKLWRPLHGEMSIRTLLKATTSSTVNMTIISSKVSFGSPSMKHDCLLEDAMGFKSYPDLSCQSNNRMWGVGWMHESYPGGYL